MIQNKKCMFCFAIWNDLFALLFCLMYLYVCPVFQLPDKLISSLVKYYYSWKKTRTRTSVMDRQARKLVTKREKDDRWACVLDTLTQMPYTNISHDELC